MRKTVRRRKENKRRYFLLLSLTGATIETYRKLIAGIKIGTQGEEPKVEFTNGSSITLEGCENDIVRWKG